MNTSEAYKQAESWVDRCRRVSPSVPDIAPRSWIVGFAVERDESF